MPSEPTISLFGDDPAVVAPARYPEAPGYRRTDTSKAAAEVNKPTAASRRELVLAVIRRGPCTADEAAEALGWNVLQSRPRTTELRALGKIEDTGVRRKTASGSSAIVWRAVA